MNMNTDQTTITAVDASLASFKRSTEELLRGKQLAIEALQKHPREAVTNSALMNHVLGMVVDAADDDYSGEQVIDPYDALKTALQSCFPRTLDPYANIRAHSFSINLHLSFDYPDSEAAFISGAEEYGRMIDALLRSFDAGIFSFRVTIFSMFHASTRTLTLSPNGNVEVVSWDPTNNPTTAAPRSSHGSFRRACAEKIWLLSPFRALALTPVAW